MKDNRNPQVTRALQLMARNRRWGACVDCPKDVDGNNYPEFCQYTARYDHQLTMLELMHLMNRTEKPSAQK